MSRKNSEPLISYETASCAFGAPTKVVGATRRSLETKREVSRKNETGNVQALNSKKDEEAKKSSRGEL